jgi:hypothetical protein
MIVLIILSIIVKIKDDWGAQRNSRGVAEYLIISAFPWKMPSLDVRNPVAERFFKRLKRNE